jgi:hypothetical protein
MSNQTTLQLDSEHCQAICEEIGERLRILLDRECSDLPLHLEVLLSRFAELDHDAPSIVPAADHMAIRSVAA